jgi:hypothetical protein
MQFLSLLSTSVTVGLFEEPNRRGIQRIFIITLYGLLEFVFLMVLIGSLIANNSSWDAMTKLSQACSNYGQIIPWIKHVPPLGKIEQGRKFWLTIWGFVTVGIVGLFLAVIILYCGVPFLLQVLRGRWARLLVIPMSLAFAIGMLVELAEMQRTRNLMKEITGAAFQDNQWGFGQFIALFLWMPLCIPLACYASRKSLLFSLVSSEPPPSPGIAYSTISNKLEVNDAEMQQS